MFIEINLFYNNNKERVCLFLPLSFSQFFLYPNLILQAERITTINILRDQDTSAKWKRIIQRSLHQTETLGC